MKSSNRLRGRISSWIQLGKSSRALVVSTRKKNARLHRLLGGVKHGTSLGMGVGWSSRFCTSRINVFSRKRNQQHNHARGHNQPWEPATTAECELVYTPASDQISLLTASQFLLTNIHVRSKEAPRRTDKNRPIQTWTQCPGYRFQDSYRKSFATRHQQLTVHPLGKRNYCLGTIRKGQASELWLFDLALGHTGQFPASQHLRENPETRWCYQNSGCSSLPYYPLVMTNIAIENNHRNSEFSH
jgi:hypothetical protein